MKVLKKIALIPLNLLYRFFPKFTIKVLFRIKHGYRLNLDKPETYNEKLNWMKVYYRDPLYIECANKLTVRDFITRIGMGKYLPKLLWSGENAKEIPFDLLPDRYVIKTTHGSGNNIFVNDSMSLNRDKVIKKLNRWVRRRYIPAYGEWVYAYSKPCIIVEELLQDSDGKTPNDYKFFSFNKYKDNNTVPFIAFDVDRFIKHQRLMYTENWDFIEDFRFDFPNDKDKQVQKPKNFDEMLEVANIIGRYFPHVRVDLYNVDEKIYIGELTFFNGAGFDRISPYKYDIEAGKYLDLSSLEKTVN